MQPMDAAWAVLKGWPQTAPFGGDEEPEAREREHSVSDVEGTTHRYGHGRTATPYISPHAQLGRYRKWIGESGAQALLAGDAAAGDIATWDKGRSVPNDGRNDTENQHGFSYRGYEQREEERLAAEQAQREAESAALRQQHTEYWAQRGKAWDESAGRFV